MTAIVSQMTFVHRSFMIFSSARAAEDGETNVRAAFTPCSDCGVEMNIDGFRSSLRFERCFIVHANAENEVLVKMPAGVAGVCVCVCLLCYRSHSKYNMYTVLES